MPPVTQSTGLTITNPLVLYRTLLATKKIEPDPSQHRLAIHLQKLYFRLKDYRPEVDFRHQIDQLDRLAQTEKANRGFEDDRTARQEPTRQWGIFESLQQQKKRAEALALTRRLTDHESAIEIKSPQGLLLYGEVGTGKSLLVDLLADSLPNQKKRRWHFNTFMLEAIAKLEILRKRRLKSSSPLNADLPSEEHSLLWLARDLISSSPIIFLDEFQLPDRAASKILSNLLTSFFHLGGVLIATSNRMPEELANASGVEFAPPSSASTGLWGNQWNLFGKTSPNGRTDSMTPGKGDFAAFLEVLRARCEAWDMEGGKDWRRREVEAHDWPANSHEQADGRPETAFGGLEPLAAGNIGLGFEQSAHLTSTIEGNEVGQARTPKHYFLKPSTNEDAALTAKKIALWKICEHDSVKMAQTATLLDLTTDVPWESTTLRVYGRILTIPRCLYGVTKWSFSELCCGTYGPADYITLASNFHTFILTEVPVLTFLQKNEARRFITLLDALYEARCKLLISADAGPDDIFFPETRRRPIEDSAHHPLSSESSDGVYSETFAEIYQDTNAPFRPNISTYASSASEPNYAPTTASAFTSTRSILADEDSDFGPVNGAGRGRGSGDGLPGAGHEMGRQETGPDFTKTGAYTGEDERFAYKRARSRLWEMCGSRWWARVEQGWWRPLDKSLRTWESDDSHSPLTTIASKAQEAVGTEEQGIFRHGASPFRTSPEPPPRFSFVHVWGMMRWGKKAGAWGKGVEGLQEKPVDSDQKQNA